MLIDLWIFQCGRLVGGCFHRFFVEGKDDFHDLLDQRLPDDAHRYDDDVSDVIELSVDRPPLVEAKIGERDEAVTGDNECVKLAHQKHKRAHGESLSGLLVLWVVFEYRYKLRKGRKGLFSGKVNKTLIATHRFFEVNEQELHEECHVIAGVKAMPDGQEHQGSQMADVPIVEELESFVNVLEDPQVRLDVE